MLDQNPITINRFRGLLSRGQRQDDNLFQAVKDYFTKLSNFYKQGESLITRPGYSAGGYISDPSWAIITDFWPLAVSGYYLGIVNGTLRSTQAVTTSLGAVPFSPTKSAVKLRLFNIAGKTYMSWLDDNFTPLSGASIGVYKNDLTAFRSAAGAAPTAAGAIVAADGAAGKVEAGLHLIAVAYETDSGHVTIPGPFISSVYTPTQYTAPGVKKINLTVIPLGPAGTVARHILASKIVRNFNGDVLIPELFFVPNGKINDNTATTLTVDFYDTELLRSADYLLDLLATIPVGFGLTTYRNRLVSYGEFNALSGDYSTVRYSEPSKFESFDSTAGFQNVYPGNGQIGVMNALEQDGALYLFKKDRTYVTRDNGGSPNSWPIDLVDVKGTHQDGIAKIDDTDLSLYKGSAVIQNDRGIYRFNGGFSELALTAAIEDIYRTEVISRTLTSTTQKGGAVLIDSERKLVFAIVTDDYYDDVASGVKGSSTIFVGNFENGVDPENIVWSTFSIPRDSGDLSVVRQLIGVPSFRKDDALFLTRDKDRIHILTHAIGKDSMPTATIPGTNLDIFFELITGPLGDEELNFTQSAIVKLLGFCANPISPIEVEISIIDLAGGKDQFGKYTKESNKQRIIFDGTQVAKVYDAGLNIRAQLPALHIKWAGGGNNLASNVCYFHEFVLMGSKAAADKVRGRP